MCFQRQDVIEEPPQKKPRTPQSEVVDADKLLAANAVQSQWCYTSLPPLQKKLSQASKLLRSSWFCNTFILLQSSIGCCGKNTSLPCSLRSWGNWKFKCNGAEVSGVSSWKIAVQLPRLLQLFRLLQFDQMRSLSLVWDRFWLKENIYMGKFALREAIQLILSSQAPAQGKVIRSGCANNTMTVDKSFSLNNTEQSQSRKPFMKRPAKKFMSGPQIWIRRK